MSRSLLHKSKLTAFTAWLSREGIEHRPGRGDFQVLQVLMPDGRWQCVFDRLSAKEHYTVAAPLERYVYQFIDASRDVPCTKNPAPILAPAVNAPVGETSFDSGWYVPGEELW